MLLPEPMSKILVVGTKDRLKDTIELLYSLEVVHVIDFPAEADGFTLGSPLAEASDASHKLLKLRSVEKDLEIDSATVKDAVPVRDIEGNLDRSIAEVEADIAGVIESKAAKQSALTEIDARLRELEPFQALPLNIEQYSGYRSLSVFAGAVAEDPTAQLTQSLKDYEIFTNSDNTFVAVFVPCDQADEAQKILASHGLMEVALPKGEGSPAQIVAQQKAQKEVLTKEMGDLNTSLEALREKHSKMVVALDEYLSIIVEKAETPLRFGESEHTFVMEAWVPSNDFARVQQTVADKFGDCIHVELLEQRARVEEPDHDDQAVLEGGTLTAEPVKEHEDEVPVYLRHKQPVRLFEYFTKLVSTPKYNEVDPTVTMAIFFPIFFGLMVGDIGYGIPFAVLGGIGLKVVKSKDWRAIATMLFWGGIFSIIFGLFLYGDLFGIPFWAHEAGELNWSTLLGVNFPHLGIWSKIYSIKTILWITIWIGIGHLLLGMALGFYNVKLRHGLKAAIFEKFSWMLVVVAAACMLWVIVPGLVYPEENPLSFTNPLLLTGIALLVVGALLAFKAEGGKVMIELLEMISNILSYTRIAAIGLSKAGMALAFNFIAIEMIASTGGINIVFGLLVFVVGHLMIFILAIISAGLQSLRLQYVEFFQKFFEGGGEDFNPLKIIRKHTTTTEA